jgi:hypothetical protein
MARLDGAHTHGGGGGGLARLIAAVLIVAALAEPVTAAAAGVIRALLIAAVVVVGLAVVAGGVLVAWRLRGPRRPAVRYLPRSTAAAVPADPRPAEIHLHFHGVAPADVPDMIDAARLVPLPRPSRARGLAEWERGR